VRSQREHERDSNYKITDHRVPHLFAPEPRSASWHPIWLCSTRHSCQVGYGALRAIPTPSLSGGN